MAQAGTKTVWDPFVRTSHWVVAACFGLAYVVGERPILVHVWAGYVIGALLILRTV